MVRQTRVKGKEDAPFDTSRSIRADHLGRLLERAMSADGPSDGIKDEVIAGIREQYREDKPGIDRTWYENRLLALDIETPNSGTYVVGVRFISNKPKVVCIEPKITMQQEADNLEQYIVGAMKQGSIWRVDPQGLPERSIINNLRQLDAESVTRYIREHDPAIERHKGRIVFEYVKTRAHSRAMTESEHIF